MQGLGLGCCSVFLSGSCVVEAGFPVQRYLN